ncbi:hypothetical protein [Bacillus coahuilensis]|uniref:hypothetical protein n=1 Tax=Bacillus coahuilensis TaxID=408580 RepID=UPI000A42AA1E|nr:hypothetical protein [Bacillus coahuilensis]
MEAQKLGIEKESAYSFEASEKGVYFMYEEVKEIVKMKSGGYRVYVSTRNINSHWYFFL